MFNKAVNRKIKKETETDFFKVKLRFQFILLNSLVNLMLLLQAYMKKILFTILMLFSLIGFGQVIIENPEGKIKVFNADENQDSVTPTPTLKSVIHFGWLHPFRGVFPIFYERALNGYFSASLGIGITYADFFRSEHFDIITGNTNSKMGFGLFSDAMVKIYPKGLAIEDFYIAPNFRFSTFNISQEDVNLNETFEMQERHYDGLLLAGTQFSDWSSVLVYDFYLGFGFSKIYTSNQELVNTSGTFEPFDIVTSEKLKPILRLGIKMGVRLN